jgi:hypothetical protein
MTLSGWGLDREDAIQFLKDVRYDDYNSFGRHFVTELIEELSKITDSDYRKLAKFLY